LVNDITLSALLRQHLAADHRWLEDRVGPRGVKMSRAGYVRMLLMFRTLHVTDDGRRHRFRAECRLYGIDDTERGLHNQIDLDLAALGHPDCSTGAVAGVLSAASFGNFAQSLGAFYVVEGSALGNALLLRQAQTGLGEASADAVRFLSATAHRAGVAFQGFRRRLDRFGLQEPASREAVVEGARNTFRACGALLDALA
jgi:heme oxygenase